MQEWIRSANLRFAFLLLYITVTSCRTIDLYFQPECVLLRCILKREPPCGQVIIIGNCTGYYEAFDLQPDYFGTLTVQIPTWHEQVSTRLPASSATLDRNKQSNTVQKASKLQD